MSDEPNDDEPLQPFSTGAKVIAALVVVFFLLVSAFFLTRVSAPAIQPTQAPPAGHYQLPCATCHTVTASAKPIGV